MTKVLFFLLLLANIVLLALHSAGHLGWQSSAREPARIAQQLHPERIVLLGRDRKSLPPPPPQPACVEIGNFTAPLAAVFETRIAELGLPSQPQKRDISEQVTHMVFLPPQNGQAGANRKLAQLRQLGVSDFYVIQDQSPRRWGISLGLFKSAEAAQTQLEAMTQAGVTGARLEAYSASFNRTAYRFQELDAKSVLALEVIKPAFSGVEVRACE
jgi:hypothetical protein